MQLFRYLFIFLALISFSKVEAQEFKRFTVDLGGGVTIPHTDINYGFAPYGNIGLRYNPTNILGIGPDFSYGFLKGDNDPYDRSFESTYYRYSFNAFLNLGRLMNFEGKVNLLGFGGIGRVHSEVTSGMRSLNTPMQTPISDVSWAYNGGLRLQYAISNSLAINLGYNFVATQTDVLDGYNQEIAANKSRDYYSAASLGLSISFGKKGAKSADFTKDNNSEETMAVKESAEKNQKSIKNLHDSMEDTDNDGVIDVLDQDNATPEGVRVDTKGLPLDTDYDGIPDYLDDCPVEFGPEDNNGCPKKTAENTADGSEQGGESGSESGEGQMAQGGENQGNQGTSGQQGGSGKYSKNADYEKGNYTEEEVAGYPVVTLQGDRSANPNKELFYIVGGSFNSKENAIDYSKYLKSEGLDSEILYVKSDGLFRVTLATFNDEYKARQKLEELRSTYNSGAWLFLQ